MPKSNKERTEQTRTELIAAARSLFVERGYAETTTPDIVAAAGVTRGALYHHFEDKRAMLRAVVEIEAATVAAAIEAASPRNATPRQMLIQGGEAFLDAMREPGRTRLLLLDGPAILGLTEMTAIDQKNGGGTLRVGLAEAFDAGLLPSVRPIDELADLLSAAYDRAALAIDSGGNASRYRQAVSALVDGLLKPA